MASYKEVVFIGGPRDGEHDSRGEWMLESWTAAGYQQCNGYLYGRLMLMHIDFINKYKD